MNDKEGLWRSPGLGLDVEIAEVPGLGIQPEIHPTPPFQIGNVDSFIAGNNIRDKNRDSGTQPSDLGWRADFYTTDGYKPQKPTKIKNPVVLFPTFEGHKGRQESFATSPKPQVNSTKLAA